MHELQDLLPELPELFEKTKIVVDGAPKEVAHLIPGAVAKAKVTPELKRQGGPRRRQLRRGDRS